MKIKRGVSLIGLQLEMKPVMEVVDSAFLTVIGKQSVITSGTENAKHMAGSYHYFGLALDYRTRNVHSSEQLSDIIARISLELMSISSKGCKYEVIVHSTHIHIECDKSP